MQLEQKYQDKEQKWEDRENKNGKVDKTMDNSE